MERVQTEHEELAERYGAIRARLLACREEAAGGAHAADALAAAMAKHLCGLQAGELPPAAQVVWTERIVRPLKADVDKPLTERAIAAMRSWPSARVNRLAAALAELEAIVQDAENDAMHEVIYAEISRTYS